MQQPAGTLAKGACSPLLARPPARPLERADAAPHCRHRPKAEHGANRRDRTRTASVSGACQALVAAAADAAEAARPTAAETARTIVEVMSHGTLATLNEDGVPLGTYTSYVLDADGLPLLRLRADATHKANLLREPRCSLFVQPQDLPARLLARVTLIGKAVQVEGETAAHAAAVHSQVAQGSVGVDAPHPSDAFFRLDIDRCFYVGGMGSMSQAEVLSKEDFSAAAPDVLRAAAPGLAAFFNRDRPEDVRRIAAHAAGAPFDALAGAELLWVDALGAYVAAEELDAAERRIHRVAFHRPVLDERDARSMLTMMAQYAWEQERDYTPPVPEAAAL